MVSFILCLLPALLATTSAQAQTVTCQKCSGSAESCQSPAPTCSVDTAKGGCFTMAEENTLRGTKATGFSRDCMNDFSGVIKDPVTVTLGNGKYLRINIKQCSTDNCNSAVLAVPTVDSTAKEVQCPTCFALNGDPCNTQTIPCTGNEDYCVDFAGTLTKGSEISSTFAAKGCGSASTKEIKAGTSLVSAVYTYTFTKATSKPAEKTTTSGASPALGKFSFALYLPGLTGLLLVKLLS
ncbi:phospholipase A2 inhibitor and Ly6/PLAUR domain-containing protein-like [Terrapene carolina triunguis]|uniref:phospholipase A2 inhibitor and Ly6/PLAUR domain-containing protein-like n=1 Tax=Terrapene triunguis TaxID=2587831 RepID=UPI000E778866|nr:phospholipase A2 inhibitor and Ly6/PLAUR domain-containing protein-like [Terrapene carolina triunguis]